MYISTLVHTGEIIGGREARAHSRPYMVLLQRHMQDGRMKHCGGFLLNEDYVMTAAHCQAKSVMFEMKDAGNILTHNLKIVIMIA